MKYFFCFLLLVFSCSLNESNQGVRYSQMPKKVPIKNRAFANKANSENVEKTLRKIKEMEDEEEEKTLKEISQNNPSYKEQKRPAQEDFPVNTAPQTKEKQILEITGMQNKAKNIQNVEMQSEVQTKFFLLTSPNYIGSSLIEAKAILEHFGVVEVQKIEDMFQLKVYPKSGLKTKSEANEFLNKVIKSSFFDVFIERIE